MTCEYKEKLDRVCEWGKMNVFEFKILIKKNLQISANNSSRYSIESTTSSSLHVAFATFKQFHINKLSKLFYNYFRHSIKYRTILLWIIGKCTDATNRIARVLVKLRGVLEADHFFGRRFRHAIDTNPIKSRHNVFRKKVVRC